MTAARTTKPRIGLGTSPSRPRNDARVPRSMPTSLSSGTGEPVAPAPHVELAKPNCSMATAAASVTTARLTPRTRSAEAPATNPSTVAARTPAMARQREADAGVLEEVRHDEARGAGQRDLHERHLADEAGDDHVGQADGHRRQRDDQRVAVVVGQHDERHDADRPPRQAADEAEALGPRHRRQALLDELAARRQARAAHVERDDDDDEGQQRADPGQGRALVGREPALRRGVVEQRLQDADRRARPRT